MTSLISRIEIAARKYARFNMWVAIGLVIAGLAIILGVAWCLVKVIDWYNRKPVAAPVVIPVAVETSFTVDVLPVAAPVETVTICGPIVTSVFDVCLTGSEPVAAPVKPVAAPKLARTVSQPKPVAAKTVAALKAEAKAKGLKGYSKLDKAGLLALLAG